MLQCESLIPGQQDVFQRQTNINTHRKYRQRVNAVCFSLHSLTQFLHIEKNDLYLNARHQRMAFNSAKLVTHASLMLRVGHRDS